MEKSADAFRTISEVATELDVPQHVLRFWESKFPQVKPLKRAGGRRYYRPQDVELLRAIKQHLYAEGFTIKGVQRILKERGVRAICATSREPPWTVASPTGSQAKENAEDLSLSDEVSDMTDDVGPTGLDAATAGRAAEDAVEETGPSSMEAGPVATPGPSLHAADIERLREILADLVRCAEILAAARRG